MMHAYLSICAEPSLALLGIAKPWVSQLAPTLQEIYIAQRINNPNLFKYFNTILPTWMSLMGSTAEFHGHTLFAEYYVLEEL